MIHTKKNAVTNTHNNPKQPNVATQKQAVTKKTSTHIHTLLTGKNIHAQTSTHIQQNKYKCTNKCIVYS